MALLGYNFGFRVSIFGSGGINYGPVRSQFKPIRPVCSAYSNTPAANRMRQNLNASETLWPPLPQGSETNPAPSAFQSAWAINCNPLVASAL